MYSWALDAEQNSKIQGSPIRVRSTTISTSFISWNSAQNIERSFLPRLVAVDIIRATWCVFINLNEDCRQYMIRYLYETIGLQNRVITLNGDKIVKRWSEFVSLSMHTVEFTKTRIRMLFYLLMYLIIEKRRDNSSNFVHPFHSVDGIFCLQINNTTTNWIEQNVYSLISYIQSIFWRICQNKLLARNREIPEECNF